jgi:hypothetical protein
MSPTLPTLAVRVGLRLQVWDIEKGVIVNDLELSDPVEYLRWATEDTLALVTAESVFHWRVTGSILFYFDFDFDFDFCKSLFSFSDPIWFVFCLCLWLNHG